ncbi:hypothetical protein ACFL54_05455 [Planctomycetota bacterium]
MRIAHSTRMQWILFGLVLIGLAFLSIDRVRQGRLFLFGLPWDAAPTFVEVNDAVATADLFIIPALGFLLVMTVIFTINVPLSILSSVQYFFKGLPKLKEGYRVLLALFLMAAFFDLATTMNFFHFKGVDYECHPGIRLIAYAYGRTAGLIIGKGVQVILGLIISVVYNKLAGFVFLAGAICYFSAAGFNIISFW